MSDLSRVWLIATPWTAACQAPLSVEFSRQEYWSGSPSPTPGDLRYPGIEATSPVSCALVGEFFTTEPPGKPETPVLCLDTESWLTPWPLGLWSTRLLCFWGFSRWGCWSGVPCPPPGALPNPGMEPRSPAVWADSLPSEPPGKPENAGVGSLSLLQGIFLSQELNQGLLNCRRILYQLSYPGKPICI